MRVHFIAIGGSVMHNLAIALAKKGYIVSGSDDYIYEPSKTHLADSGLLPASLGWHPDKLDNDIDAVVIGMHAQEDNPELLRAQELGLQIYSYPEFIYEQAAEKTRVVIGGSHGKTTITSMIMHVLKTLGHDFDYLVGAELEDFDGMVRITKESRLMIIEGDEYLASPLDKRPKFHLYKANIGLISGIAWDHINVFPTFDSYNEQFKLFIKSIEPHGTLVYNKEDKALQDMVSADNSQINKHGYRTPEYIINKGITYIKTPAEDVSLQVFGRHNLSNIAAAYTVCEWIGVSRIDFYGAIKSFKGASRRLEYVADKDGSVIYKDFAHSPAKLKATIHAVKEQYPGMQLMAIIELHTYSSLNEEFLTQYQDTMNEADLPVVFINLDTFKQKNISPIPAEKLKKAFNNEKIHYFTNIEGLRKFLEETDHRGKNLLFMSSGNFGGVNVANFLDFFFLE